SQMVALGVAETVASLLPGQTVSVKWPNDIYVGDRKICGILIECSLNGRRVSRAICGIGINVNQEVFRSDAPNPVSIRQLTGADTPLEPLLNYVTSRILDLAETPREEWPRIAGAYFDRLYRREGIHPFLEVATGLRFNGHIEAVAPTGHITIADSSTCEQRRYAFKEVVFLHE
ncbi:MAG: biotin--[acetyl-CoA-carboxylase] ligase, partial [Duncaniella sp.]|nr:biotin--[acetyl-CoA-carboxylase] ligase [Duncaniella sp.]